MTWTFKESLPLRGRHRRALYQCNCGVIKSVLIQSVKNGSSNSCGCLQREVAKKQLQTIRYQQTHGLTGTFQYKRAQKIFRRTSDQTNEYYYGLLNPIDFPTLEALANYLAGLPGFSEAESSRLEVDRINNNLGYQRGNLRWATRSENMRNTSKFKLTSDIIEKIKLLRGRGLTIRRIATELNLGSSTVHRVVKCG